MEIGIIFIHLQIFKQGFFGSKKITFEQKSVSKPEFRIMKLYTFIVLRYSNFYLFKFKSYKTF